jgi:hypothetical protein
VNACVFSVSSATGGFISNPWSNVAPFVYIFSAENDRKSNIDVLEANKNSNKEDIRRLRDDNKDLRQKLAQLQKVNTDI